MDFVRMIPTVALVMVSLAREMALVEFARQAPPALHRVLSAPMETAVTLAVDSLMFVAETTKVAVCSAAMSLVALVAMTTRVALHRLTAATVTINASAIFAQPLAHHLLVSLHKFLAPELLLISAATLIKFVKNLTLAGDRELLSAATSSAGIVAKQDSRAVPLLTVAPSLV